VQLTPLETIKCDIRGQVCPSSLLNGLKEINNNRDKLVSGSAELIIYTDNRDALITIPGAAESMGFKVYTEKAEDGSYRIVIKKTGDHG